MTYFGTNRNLYLGIEVLTDDGAVYLDNAKVESIPDSEVKPEKISDEEDPEQPNPEKPGTENPITGTDSHALFSSLLSCLLFACFMAFSILRKNRRLEK